MTINLDERDVECVDDERIDVFTLNGTTYTVPAKPVAGFALKYLSYAREHGEDEAAAFLLELMLGKEGYEALSSVEDLEDSALLTIFNVCLDLALGAIEGPKGF